jgi:hypothetical protein
MVVDPFVWVEGLGERGEGDPGRKPRLRRDDVTKKRVLTLSP